MWVEERVGAAAWGDLAARETVEFGRWHAGWRTHEGPK